MLPPIFVPTKGARKRLIFDYLDAIAVVDKCDLTSYKERCQEIFLIQSSNIQEKRFLIQKHCREFGINEILMVDDDVIITKARLKNLCGFARNNSLAFCTFSSFTGINIPFQTTPVMYLNFMELPEFTLDEVYEDLDMEFTCLEKGIRVGCLCGRVDYFYPMGVNSMIGDRNQRKINTVLKHPKYLNEQGIICRE